MTAHVSLQTLTSSCAPSGAVMPSGKSDVVTDVASR
jgi:hypothetical protein